MSANKPKLEEKLDELMDMVDENQVLLKKIERRLYWSQAIKIIYWVVIIGIGVLGYYAALPYLQQLQNTYDGLQNGVSSVTELFQKEQ